MKRVYRDTLDDVSKTMNSKIIDFFDHNLEYIDRNGVEKTEEIN